MKSTLLLNLLISIFACSLPGSLRADDWPQWMGPQRDGIWRETGIVERFPEGGPKVRWRLAIGAGYSSPTVAGGKVFVLDRQRRSDPANPQPRNTGKRIAIPGVERVLCVDEATGRILWTQEYPCDYTMSYNAGPRAAPIVDGNRVYTLGGEAHFQCRQIDDGKLLWEKRITADRTPVWGFSASPLIDGDKLIVIGGDPAGAVLALNKLTGELLWKAIPVREPGYSSPIIIEAGGTRQLIVWTPESLNSLDPETGKIYWSEAMLCRSGLSVATTRRVGDLLYVTSFYSGSMMLRLDPKKPAVTLLWKMGNSERKTVALQGLICTPIIKDDFIYGVCSYGQAPLRESPIGRARLGNLRRHHGRSRARAMGERVHYPQWKPLFPVQREWGFDHREADAAGVSGAEPGAPDRPAQSRSGPSCRLVSAGLRQPMRLRSQRQGTDLRVTGGSGRQVTRERCSCSLSAVLGVKSWGEGPRGK